jgi:tetratricopeptide (TPR) repeat protein
MKTTLIRSILIQPTIIAATIGLLLATTVTAQIHDPRALAADPATADKPVAPRLTGLGDYSRDITTSNVDSKFFFAQGLRLTYGFNHSEALRAFKEAVRLDPDNAMAYWGWSLVLGPNLNLPMQPEVIEQAYTAIQRAVALKDQVSPVEAAFIDALATRYSATNEDRVELDQNYADAMAELTAAYPDDLDAATLYGAALMNLSPWNYWHRDGVPYDRTMIFIDVFEAIQERDPKHPGALHYYIHAVEAQHAAWGEIAADNLRGLMPDAGHLVHMPSHIYMRLGRYEDAYQVNINAAKADERYIAQCQAQGLYAVGYYPHNVHFLIWAATLQGKSQAAIETATKMRDELPEFLQLEGDVPRAVSGDAWRIHEHFMSQRLYSLVRFGRWEEVLEEPRPPESALFMNGIWHYARGLAFINWDRLEDAQLELDRLSAILSEAEFEEYWINASLGTSLLSIASETLAGEIFARQEEWHQAVIHLTRAVRLQDGLAYTEPPDWYFPTRHYLGAALIEADRADEAETVYWTDLKLTPSNGYALFGLMQAQEAQGKTAAAAETRARFKAAWALADVALTTSKF